MLHSKASNFAILAAVCPPGIGADRSAYAQVHFHSDTDWMRGTDFA